jgi:hypothetical protein
MAGGLLAIAGITTCLGHCLSRRRAVFGPSGGRIARASYSSRLSRASWSRDIEVVTETALTHVVTETGTGEKQSQWRKPSLGTSGNRHWGKFFGAGLAFRYGKRVGIFSRAVGDGFGFLNGRDFSPVVGSVSNLPRGVSIS